MAVEIRVPEMGESVVEATIVRWLKQIGEALSPGEPVVELETEKANVEVPSPEGGVLESVTRGEGENVSVGEVLGQVGTSAAQQPAAPAAATAEAAERRDAPAVHKTEGEEGGKITPLAQRIAAEHGVNLAQVKGTGAGGRVTQQDVLDHVANQQQAKQAAAERPSAPGEPPAPAQPAAEPPRPTEPQPRMQPAPAPSAPRPGRYEERVRMTRRKQTMARRMLEARQTTAMTTTFNEVDMSGILEMRTQYRQGFRERHEVDLGFMSFFIKATVAALKAYPVVNAEIQGDEIVYKYYYDIGIAVGTDEGLVVPNIRDADKKGFAGLEADVRDLAERTRNRKLGLEDLQGGTFTITNGGVFGSLNSTPILNPPQVGILGMHRTQERPVAVNGQVAVRPMMYLALSYDHRIVEGREAVLFLVKVKEMIEDPRRLLLEP